MWSTPICRLRSLFIIVHLLLFAEHTNAANENPLSSSFVPAFEYNRNPNRNQNRHHQRQRHSKLEMKTNANSGDVNHELDAMAYNSFASSAVDITQANVNAIKGNSNQDMNILTFVRSARDIDRNVRRKFLHHVVMATGTGTGTDTGTDDNHNISTSTIMAMPPTEMTSNIMARVPSPSGEKIAIFTKPSTSSSTSTSSEDSQQVVELWTNANAHSGGGGQPLTLARKIVLDAKLHGPVCTDTSWFGSFQWNEDETAIVYTAEMNAPKTRSFFTKASPGESQSQSVGNVDGNGNGNGNGKSDVIVGGTNTLGFGKGENWGEKYTKTCRLDLFVLHVDTGKVAKVSNVPGGRSDSDSGDVVNCEESGTNGGYTLGQPTFSPCGKHLVYTAWDAGEGGYMPKRLGSIYCYQRHCAIYSSPVQKLLESLSNTKSVSGDGIDDNDTDTDETENDGPYVCLTDGDRLARSPRFIKVDMLNDDADAGAGTKLLFLSNRKGFDTHGGCMALHSYDWSNAKGVMMETRKEVVSVVDSPEDDDAFPGLFMNQLPGQTFVSKNGKYIYATTQWRSIVKIIRISLLTGEVRPIDFRLRLDQDQDQDVDGDKNNASQSLLCLTEEGDAIVAQMEPNAPPTIGFIPASSLEHDGDEGKEGAITASSSSILARLGPISATSAFIPQSIADRHSEQKLTYEVIRTHPSHGTVMAPVEGILLLPPGAGACTDKEDRDRIVPLIVVPHGGPHSCSSTSYIPSYAFLCESGYGLLHVNFRGSSGFGQDALESLAGNVGSQDVKDVVHLTHHVLEKFSDCLDASRVGVCGGSHGGFLAGHLIGQYPELYKVAAMRNPVTNIPTMTTATDIPDWCYVEGLGLGSYDWKSFKGPKKEELSIMWDASPISHIEKVEAPTLVAIGNSDKRVPPSQGIEYYYALRSKGVKTKLLLYDEDDHAIDKVQSEADHWINIKQWFDKHL